MILIYDWYLSNKGNLLKVNVHSTRFSHLFNSPIRNIIVYHINNGNSIKRL